LCKTCRRRFIVDHGFSRIHSAPRVVVAAVDLWAKKVSFREIADHFRSTYLIPVTKSTIERWVKRMRRRLAYYADTSGPSVGDIWHADETMVNVDGQLRYVWNVMDHETRYWLASPVSEGRKVSDARETLRRAKGVAGFRPRALVTDGYPPYGEAVRKELYANTDFTTHFVIPPIRKVIENRLLDLHPGNNIMERLQGIQRGITKVMRGFNDLASAQDQIDGYRGYYNLVRPHQGLGGMTPAERAGLSTPVLANEGKLMSVLVAAYRLRGQADTPRIR
jgi:transposase-like protein